MGLEGRGRGWVGGSGWGEVGGEQWVGGSGWGGAVGGRQREGFYSKILLSMKLLGTILN